MADLDKNIGEDEPNAPETFIRALRGAKAEPVFVPRTLDETILRQARRHLARRSGRQFRLWRVLPWLATASAVIVAIVFVYLAHKPQFAREDVNRDGRVDILDAFALARQIQAGKGLKLELDVNGDGIVDARDAEVIAAEAVKLDSPGKS